MDGFESLSDTRWDVVIDGTGLPQALLALALSRAKKNVLHVDPAGYYGGHEAALTLDEAKAWAAVHAAPLDTKADGTTNLFASATFAEAEPNPDGDKGSQLAASRAYTIALAPQVIHGRSELVSQLVSSCAFRQLEFLAVGSFYIFDPSSSTLARVPSTREDIFAATAIPARSKRALMKFLKFVLEHDTEPNLSAWQPHADKELSAFLVDPAAGFRLDKDLQAYIIAMTLSTDGRISVSDGLRTLHRHLTSMGAFGPGFAAVYPKWGGISEISQVACRAGAVGGAIYMLGMGTRGMEYEEGDAGRVTLNDDTVVTTKLFVCGTERAVAAPDVSGVRRLTAVIGAPLSSLFEVVVEGSPTPAVAIVAFPQDTLAGDDGEKFSFPIYAMVHSSETGECPDGQSIVYLSTVATPASSSFLEQALACLLKVVDSEEHPGVLCRLAYEQQSSSASDDARKQAGVFKFPAPSTQLAFDDSILGVVKEAWAAALGEEADSTKYLKFEDREGVGDEDMYE